MRLVADVPRSDVSVNVGGARGPHLAVGALVAVPLAAEIAQMPGDSGLLGESAATVEAFKPLPLVRVVSVPVGQALQLGRVAAEEAVRAAPFALLQLEVTWKKATRGVVNRMDLGSGRRPCNWIAAAVI